MSTPAATNSLLAAPSELAGRLGVSETDPHLLSALRSATARFQAAVRCPIVPTVDETVVLDTDGTWSLRLPAAPVTAVSRVAIHDTEITDYRFSRVGLLRRPGGWPDDLGAVEVTYSHGYDPIPDEIREVVLDAAEMLYASAEDIASMTVGGQQITFRQGVSRSWSLVVDLYRLNRGDAA